MSAKRCQYGKANPPQCNEDATRKYGDYWFCEEHGSRNKSPAGAATADNQKDVSESGVKVPVPDRKEGQ
jgi:hypothetical protein